MKTQQKVVDLFKKILGRDISGQNEYIEKQIGRSEEGYVVELLRSQEFNQKENVSCDILFLGNCQMGVISPLVASMSGLKTKHVELTEANINRINNGEIYIAADVVHSKYIVTHGIGGVFQDFIKLLLGGDGRKVINIPSIVFPAFHPDMIYIRKSGGLVNRYVGDYQSYIAFHAWSHGLNVDQTVGLYCDDVFESLGYYDFYKNSKRFLIKKGADLEFPLVDLVYKWMSRGDFMYSINHPKKFVLEDVAVRIMKKLNIPYLLGISSHVSDSLASGLVWSVYPEVAKRFGFASNYAFRINGKVYGLKDFLELSFKNFDSYGIEDKKEFVHDRLSSKMNNTLDEIIRDKITKAKQIVSEAKSQKIIGDKFLENPYKKMPPYSFWRNNVVSPKFSDVNPVSEAKFLIYPSEKFATAGSCFAQHISKTLVQNGFNYYVPEDGADLTEEERANGNYSVFSARYGNIYTARQLRQLFERAYGIFNPHNEVWRRPDGTFSDPFRPEIEANGFLSEEQLLSSQNFHLSKVREMFENLDVFVFTLGLTETWLSKVDGAVYPLAPGVVAGGFDDRLHEFKNMSYSDVVEDMQIFIDYLDQVNNKAKVILTVSPVPLIATYSGKSALSATTYSKAVLRSASQYLADSNINVDYFPSFEIVTGSHVGNKYYEDNLRLVRPEGVSHVMRLFMRNYAGQKLGGDSGSNLIELSDELNNVAHIVCDEENIVKFRN